jgi:hypothetical protein
MGVRTVLVSGDNRGSAQAVARALGIDMADVRAEVLPATRPAWCGRAEAAWAATSVVAMVGDGINDAPALAAADVGMAMGTGTDVAMHAAGITLMRGDPALVAEAIDISRRTTQDPPEPVLGLCLQRGRHPAGGLRPAEPGDRRRGHGLQQRQRGQQCAAAGSRPAACSAPAARPRRCAHESFASLRGGHLAQQEGRRPARYSVRHQAALDLAITKRSGTALLVVVVEDLEAVVAAVAQRRQPQHQVGQRVAVHAFTREDAEGARRLMRSSTVRVSCHMKSDSCTRKILRDPVGPARPAGCWWRKLWKLSSRGPGWARRRADHVPGGGATR